MRAGCFAELRVIHLLNRRFVPFYFNTGGPGLGKDAAAAEFVKGKVKNKWAHFTAFTPMGEPFDESDVYADKDAIFDFLMNLLRKHPEYDHMTAAENTTLRTAADDPEDAAAQLAAGVLLEELGGYDMAAPFCHRILDGSGEGNVRADAHRGLARMARYGKDWVKLEKLLAVAENESAKKRLGLEAD